MSKATDELVLAGRVRKWLVAHHEFEQGDATKNDCHALIGHALGLCNSFVNFYNKWEPMVEHDEDYRMTTEELISALIFDHDSPGVFEEEGIRLPEEDCMVLGREILSLIESRYLIREGVTERLEDARK